jgi:hypothetical protein
MLIEDFNMVHVLNYLNYCLWQFLPCRAPMTTGLQPVVSDPADSNFRSRQRGRRRQLHCPAHPDQLIQGNGKKYFLHLLSPEELKQRGYSDKRARLIINAYPVLVLSTEWLENLFCSKCGTSQWCHVIRHDGNVHTVRWASRDLWQQVAHVDPAESNPGVGEFTRREARRNRRRRVDGKRFFDC